MMPATCCDLQGTFDMFLSTYCCHIKRIGLSFHTFRKKRLLLRWFYMPSILEVDNQLIKSFNRKNRHTCYQRRLTCIGSRNKDRSETHLTSQFYHGQNA